MYCPRCGQQFTSEVRFCSRCGMSLNAIAAITSREGLVAPADSKVAFSKRPPRQKGMRVGAVLMLGSLALSPLFIAICVGVDEAAPMIFPFTTFLIGLAVLLYSYVFADDRISSAKFSETYHLQSDTSPSLESFKVRGRVMRERAERPSVVEHTTQFFD